MARVCHGRGGSRKVLPGCFRGVDSKMGGREMEGVCVEDGGCDWGIRSMVTKESAGFQISEHDCVLCRRERLISRHERPSIRTDAAFEELWQHGVVFRRDGGVYGRLDA